MSGGGNPNHDPKNGEFTSGGGGSVSVGSKKFRDVLNDPNAKSYEVAGANAKELYRIRNEIDKAARVGNVAKVNKLHALYTAVHTVGSARHMSMPVHGTMINTFAKI